MLFLQVIKESFPPFFNRLYNNTMLLICQHLSKKKELTDQCKFFFQYGRSNYERHVFVSYDFNPESNS